MGTEKRRIATFAIHVCVTCALFAINASAHASPAIVNDDGEGNYTVISDPCSTSTYCYLEEKLHGTTTWTGAASGGNDYVATDKRLGVHAYRFVDVEIDYEFGISNTYTSGETTVTVGPTDPAELLLRLASAVEPYFIEMMDNQGATSAQKTQAQTDLQALASDISQKPGALYIEDELIVLYKLKLLEEHDSRFQGGFPDDIPQLMSRYDELADWMSRES